ncbi:uncharacterized protein LOC104682667 [Rhinopithecus roxellana]|uniref:uncharacterized protein LOC104682667 n=1 Tax=Rhinopithecus roxellana TaxID=61622 RepID=UPI0012377D1B|nr:uncharacterized protein LOC104682667 [Rhinopithecus roxellana]
MEPEFLRSVGVKLGPTHTPKTCPRASPSHPPSQGRRDPVPVEVGKPSRVQKAEAMAQRGVAAFRGSALGLRTQAAEMLAPPTRARQPMLPGELRGAEVPGEPAPGARALPDLGNRQSGAPGSKS